MKRCGEAMPAPNKRTAKDSKTLMIGLLLISPSQSDRNSEPEPKAVARRFIERLTPTRTSTNVKAQNLGATKPSSLTTCPSGIVHILKLPSSNDKHRKQLVSRIFYCFASERSRVALAPCLQSRFAILNRALKQPD